MGRKTNTVVKGAEIGGATGMVVGAAPGAFGMVIAIGTLGVEASGAYDLAIMSGLLFGFGGAALAVGGAVIGGGIGLAYVVGRSLFSSSENQNTSNNNSSPTSSLNYSPG
jgi:hypothetical protein